MVVDLRENTDKLEELLHNTLNKYKGVKGLTILLPPGNFFLAKTEIFHTSSIMHDDGCERNEIKEASIRLLNWDNLTIKGSVGPSGEILTKLIVPNDEIEQSLKPSAIWAEECSKLKIENIEFFFSKPLSYFGRVVEKTLDSITIKPSRSDYPDKCPIYCMNKFINGTLTGKSLTLGFGSYSSMKKKEDGNFGLVDRNISSTVSVGDYLSWHLSGLTDFLLFFGSCDDLVLENIRISEASGFGILTECCHNILAKKVIIKAREGFQSVSRDGWKIFRCSGRVEVVSSHIEGTRMDGQNIHSNYLVIKKIEKNRIEAEMKYAPSKVHSNSFLELYKGCNVKKVNILSSQILMSEFRMTHQEGDDTAAKAVLDKENRYNLYEFILDEEVDKSYLGAYANLSCFTVDEYICRDTYFKNIAGCGNLVRSRKAYFENNKYENIMNAGILIGAEWDTHMEAMNPESVEINSCTFINNGFSPRYGTKAMAAIACVSQGFGSSAVIGKLSVNNCHFYSLDRAIEIRNLKEFILSNNSFKDVNEHFFIEKQNEGN